MKTATRTRTPVEVLLFGLLFIIPWFVGAGHLLMSLLRIFR